MKSKSPPKTLPISFEPIFTFSSAFSFPLLHDTRLTWARKESQFIFSRREALPSSSARTHTHTPLEKKKPMRMIQQNKTANVTFIQLTAPCKGTKSGRGKDRKKKRKKEEEQGRGRGKVKVEMTTGRFTGPSVREEKLMSEILFSKSSYLVRKNSFSLRHTL